MRLALMEFSARSTTGAWVVAHFPDAALRLATHGVLSIGVGSSPVPAQPVEARVATRGVRLGPGGNERRYVAAHGHRQLSVDHDSRGHRTVHARQHRR